MSGRATLLALPRRVFVSPVPVTHVATHIMQIRYVFGSLLLVGALGFLVASSMKSNVLRSIPVADLRSKDGGSETMVGQRLRVVGFVGDQGVTKTQEKGAGGEADVCHFAVVEGSSRVLVAYADTLPDTFRKGGPVQVDGVYTAPGQMRAEHVLTKCPSKYESGEKGLGASAKTGAAIPASASTS